MTPTSHDAIHKAAKDTTRYMSAQLRSEARASGWPQHITSGLHVRYNSEAGFTTHVHPQHRAHALDLEFGTPGQQPTYAMRRFGNRDSDRVEVEKFFLNRVTHHLKGNVLGDKIL